MPPKFTIVEAGGVEFAPELAELESQIFHDEPLGRAAFGPQSKSEEARRRRIDQILTPAEGSENYFAKAIDENGRTIGASFWNLRYEPWAPKESDGELKRDKFPPGTNFDVVELAFGKASRNRVRNMSGKKCGSKSSAPSSFAVTLFHANSREALNILLVLPEYQRQGIGSALLEEGLRKADEAGLVVWLGASRYGRGLYLKHGFELNESWEIDLRPHGQDFVDEQACMIRQPRPLVEES